MISLYIVTLDQTLKDKKRGRMNKLITVIKWYSKKYAILKIQKKKKVKKAQRKEMKQIEEKDIRIYLAKTLMFLLK